MFTRLKFSLILIVIAVCLGTRTTPIQAQAIPTVNIILGMDISGSNYSVNSERDNGLVAIEDRDADRSTPEIDEAQARPTDPNNIRYDSATSILAWLGQNQASLGVQMNINLIEFANDATVWSNNWTNITTFADLNFALPKPNPNTAAGEANWGALIDAATSAFSEAPGSNTTNVLLIITDSIDCTGGQCGGISSVIANQIDALQLPPNTITHMLLTPFTTNVTAFWGINAQGGTDMLDTVTRFVERGGGNLYSFDSIDKMPLILTQLLISEVGRSRGRLNLPEDNTLDLDLVNWSDIAPNLMYADSASTGFNIPPYQAEGHFLALLEQNIPNASYNPPRFYEEGNRTKPVDIDGTWIQQGSTYQLRLPSPPRQIIAPISAGFNVSSFVFYTPAQPKVTIEILNDSQPIQYGQAQVLYELLNTQNTAFLQDDLPVVSAVVEIAGEDSFSLTNFTRVMTEDGTPALRSEPFFLQYASSYTISVDSDKNPAWEDNYSYDFLVPERQQLTADALTFRAQIGEDATTSNLSIARDTAIPIVLRAFVNGNAYPIPSGASATLQTFPIEGDACASIQPTTPTFVVDDENGVRVLTTSLEFRESGACRLDVQVELAEVIYPLSQTLTIDTTAEMTRSIEVGATTRLTISPVVDSYQMTDYQATLTNLDILKTINWAFTDTNPPFPTGEWALQVGFVNATGDELITPPEFVGATYPNRSYCDNPNDSVPFTLEIIDERQVDQAQVLGICLNNTDSRGVYLATIKDLPAGDYVVNIRLNTQNMTLNRDVFSYDTSLVSGGAIFVQPIALRITQSSEAAFIRFLAIAGTFLVGFVVLIVVLVVFYLFVRAIDSRRYPLKGTVSILVRNGLEQVIWEQKLPSVHTKKYAMSAFEQNMYISMLKIQEMVISTHKDRTMHDRGQIEVTLTFTNGGRQPILLEANMPEFITQIDDYTYIIKNTLAGIRPSYDSPRQPVIGDVS